MRNDTGLLTLFMAHRDALLAYASGIVGDHADAEDVLQEAYLRFDAVAGAKPLDEPVGYLYRIVRNLAVDGRRRKTRESRLILADTASAEETPEDRPSPEAEAAGRDDLRVMREAMAELPERTRIALEMHRFGGRTLKDIAAFLDVSIGTAHALVIGGLEHCRARLCRR